MSQAPSMPMYWDAYLADTTHLTTEEHGAYMLLLAAMWRRNGSVPDDDKDNARILGLTVSKWRKVKARLAATIAGFRVEDGTITQKKLQEIWKNTQEKIETNRTNGAKGGRPKSKENKDIDKAKGSVSDKPIETIPEPEPEPYKEGTNVPLVQPPFSKQDFQDFWDAYPHRHGKKKRADAEKAFARAIKRGATVSQIADGVRDMSRDPDVQRGYARDPTTWLNQSGWTDEIPAQPQFKTIPGGQNERSDNRNPADDPTLRSISRAAQMS